MELNDVDGDKVLLNFHTDGRGSEIQPSQLKPGYTVAILYAEMRMFMDGGIGIRHEEPQLLKVS